MASLAENIFYEYIYGDWDSLQRWAWLYVHVGILLATVLFGYTIAHERYLLTALLLPFPVGFLYRRYTYAKPANQRD
jgi:hypothetical protein